MTHRFLACAALSAATLLVISAQPAPKAASKKAWTAPIASDGHPDLQGVWTNATITRMARPAEFNGKLNLTDAEAKAYEAKDHDAAEEKPGKDGVTLGGAVFSGANAGYNVLFIDRGNELARVDGNEAQFADRRSSRWQGSSARSDRQELVAAADVVARAARGGGQYDSVKNRPVSERCLVGFGSTSGPPMLPVLYNNNYQIVQTPTP